MNASTLPTVTLNRLFLLLIQILHVCLMDVKPQRERFTPDYKVYHNLTSIALTLDHFIKENENFVRLVDPSKYLSKQGRKQYVLHVTNFANARLEDTERVKVLLSFGEHAREFLPIESLFHLLRRLLKNWKSFDRSDVNLDKLDIYVIALANPDGRQHVETSKNYCWRGTSSGVDINRNFDWEFGGKGSSKDPTDEEYHGIKPFSEPESHVYRDLTEEVQFDGFLSLHSGIKQIYIPFADSVSQKTGRVPDNVKEMTKLAQELATSTIYKYQYGRAVNLNDYSADGTVFDYMAGRRKIPFSYAIELWGPDKHQGPSCFDLFNPPNSRVDIVVSNLYPLYIKFFDYLLDWKKQSSLNNKLEKADRSEQLSDKSLPYSALEEQDVSSLSPILFLLCALVILTIVVAVYGKYPLCRRMYQRRRVVSLRALSSTLSLNLFSV
ncbi:carboxypeptidase A4-like [Mercenaria mercenaria]|uniref:carboxypeptidase A4-like n=1 Tax=Mercenaria mercenaria TaxID=6596 RepID=UPI00234E55AD|nr:carboxypeptidase A4-like [Mercenaria mercenaria]